MTARRKDLEAEVRRRLSEALDQTMGRPLNDALRAEIKEKVLSQLKEHLASLQERGELAEPRLFCFLHKADRARFCVVDEERLREMEASGEIDEWER